MPSFTWSASADSDVAALNVGEPLGFKSVRPTFGGTNKAARIAGADPKGGFLLSVHFQSSDFHRVDGTAVLVAPGIALCANHVVDEHLEEMLIPGGTLALCAGYTTHGAQLWKVTHITRVPNSDVCILCLALTSGLPPDRTFYQASISTRFPKLGERLFILGYRPESDNFIDLKEGDPDAAGMDLVVCTGSVTQLFNEGPDRFLYPGPSVMVECPAWGGMSGGPVFDSEGLLVGILTASLSSAGGDTSPSLVSLLWVALPHRFDGGWPTADGLQSLLERRGCEIDNRAAVDVTYAGAEVNVTYTPW